MDQQDNNKRVQYYSDGQFSDDMPFSGSNSSGTDDYHGATAPSGSGEGRTSVNSDTMACGAAAKKRKLPTWAKALIIVAAVIFGIMLISVGCSNAFDKIAGSDSTAVSTGFGYDYIGVLCVEGTIDEYGTDTYNHQYLLNAIDAMMEDSHNQGMILYVNTPGGSVYASDQLYLKIREYQETTGRPVYSSMQSQATSGGYYISASCDKIIADRNCWTGSIGVTMGSFVDISGLLENLGIKTTTITSGANKAMGSNVEPMTSEQRAIFQSLVDEAYEQFVSIVAEGRNMSTDEVKALADGRIYTAKQAKANGLIDEIGTFEDAVSLMHTNYQMEDNVYVEYFQPEEQLDLSSLLGIIADKADKSSITDAEAIEELLKINGTFRVSYISSVTR